MTGTEEEEEGGGKGWGRRKFAAVALTDRGGNRTGKCDTNGDEDPRPFHLTAAQRCSLRWRTLLPPTHCRFFADSSSPSAALMTIACKLPDQTQPNHHEQSRNKVLL
eukprot:749187-Hanusia_phi.AAC.1